MGRFGGRRLMCQIPTPVCPDNAAILSEGDGVCPTIRLVVSLDQFPMRASVGKNAADDLSDAIAII